MKKSVKKRGFTIVELVIVIGVIAVLAAVIIPTFSGIIDKAKNSAATQEALGAYTEYMIEHAAGGNSSEYVFYKTEDKIVVLKNGGVLDVYETEEEAIKATFDNPETSEDESEGISLGTVEINGLYFMQSGEQECNHSYVSVVTAPTCVNDGYTTHTCSLCGDSYTDSETTPTGVHEYIDGKCVCGAEEWIIGKTVGYIGEPGERGTCFEIKTASEIGKYTAIIWPGNSGWTGENTLFVYYPSQFVSLDVPEITILVETQSIKGLKLNSDGGFRKLTGTTVTNESIGLTPGKKYELTFDFQKMTWSIQEIGAID